METDKVVIEVPAVADGKLVEIKVESGATVQAGDVLATIEEGAAGDTAGDEGGSDEQAQEKSAGESQPAEEKSESTGSDGAIASPAAEKLMAEQNLTANDVQGTGKDGRITKADVQQAMESRQPSGSANADNLVPENEHADRKALGEVVPDRTEQRVPMTRIRQRIAERLLSVTQNTAMLTTFNEVD